MSNEDGGEEVKASNSGEGDVCRDYLKNICTRGSRCRFYHPPKEEGSEGSEKEEYNFCIDYQNPRGCHRHQCRYVHAKREDAERYKRSGEVTLSLACAIAAVTQKDAINGIPFCKEFKMGKCQRGPRCRYWHVDPETERQNRFGDPRGRGPPPSMGRGAPQNGVNPWGGGAGAPPMHQGGPPMHSMYHSGGPPIDVPPEYPYPGKRGRYDDGPDMAYQELERRNMELQKENDSLKRELARERERYEDLYALFRQHQHQSAANQAVANAAVQAASAAVSMPAQSVPAPIVGYTMPPSNSGYRATLQ